MRQYIKFKRVVYAVFRYKSRKTKPSWFHWISGKDEKEGGGKIRIGKKAAAEKKPPGMPVHLIHVISSFIVLDILVIIYSDR